MVYTKLSATRDLLFRCNVEFQLETLCSMIVTLKLHLKQSITNRNRIFYRRIEDEILH